MSVENLSKTLKIVKTEQKIDTLSDFKNLTLYSSKYY